MVEVYHVAADVSRGGLFAEEVAAAGHTVGEGEGGDADGAVFVDGLWGSGVDFVEVDFVGGVGAEVVYLWLEDAL